MQFILKHFDTPLLDFEADPSSSDTTCRITRRHPGQEGLLPLGMEPSDAGLERWLRRRTIPRNRAYVDALLSKTGLSVNRPLGILLGQIGIRFVMTWYGGILTAAVVAFPLMYRTARGAFESFDNTLAYSGQTLGLSNTYIFWRIRMPYCRQGILAGTVLAFARALGEYGATSMLIGYTPGKTATISTAVYQYWRTNDEQSAFLWVMINLAISAVVLLAVNMLEKKNGRKGARR